MSESGLCCLEERDVIGGQEVVEGYLNSGSS